MLPKDYYKILKESKAIQFEQYSHEDLGILLRFLTASKYAPEVLELGTGTGLSLAWILDSLDPKGSVISVEKQVEYQKTAISFFGDDPRVEFVLEDAHLWVYKNQDRRFDLIFAGT